MAAKVPTPDDVIALVGDGGMQQLIAQAQAQQAQAVVDAHQALVEHAAAAGVSVAAMTDADMHMVTAAAAVVDDSSAMLGKVEESSAMDFMPLPATSVVLGAPTTATAATTAAIATATTGDSVTATTDASCALPLSIDPSSTGTSPNASGSAALAVPTTIIKRKSIPLSMKKEAIEWILGPGKGVPSRAEKHFSALHWDVSASSFRKWWKNREKILRDASHKKRISGGGRKPYLELAEEKLLVVVIQERAKKDRVTRKWIAKTAQHMFQRTPASFKASENWVTKFIRRNGLTLKRSYVTYETHQSQTHTGLGLSAGTSDSVGVAGTHAGVGTGVDDRDDDGDDAMAHQHHDQQHQHQQHMEIDVDDDDSSNDHDGDAREHVVNDEQRKTVVV